jgi:hypothetical protein
MLEKLQLRIAELTSVRQYSFWAALAAVGIIAIKASANNPVTGAAAIFKTCLIFVSLV